MDATQAIKMMFPYHTIALFTEDNTLKFNGVFKTQSRVVNVFKYKSADELLVFISDMCTALRTQHTKPYTTIFESRDELNVVHLYGFPIVIDAHTMDMINTYLNFE